MQIKIQYYDGLPACVPVWNIFGTLDGMEENIETVIDMRALLSVTRGSREAATK